MVFLETALLGAYLIEPEPIRDERGFFARTYDADEFAERNLRTAFSQCSISYNRRAGTLRGMHFQEVPHQEAKLVRCTAGAIFDVIIDLRPESPMFTRWVGAELTAENRRALYVPEGFAHGFQTLLDQTEVFYQISVPYHPTSARGVRWDDPAFGIEWPPAGERTISERDRNHPDFVS